MHINMVHGSLSENNLTQNFISQNISNMKYSQFTVYIDLKMPPVHEF